jgi:DNA-binding MarR family transcriptional regulator
MTMTADQIITAAIEIEAQLSQINITLLQYRILHVLAEHGDMRIGELADRVGILGQYMSAMAKILERKGMIERVHSKIDRRTVKVRLVDATIYEAAWRQLYSIWPPLLPSTVE